MDGWIVGFTESGKANEQCHITNGSTGVSLIVKIKFVTDILLTVQLMSLMAISPNCLLVCLCPFSVKLSFGLYLAERIEYFFYFPVTLTGFDVRRLVGALRDRKAINVENSFCLYVCIVLRRLEASPQRVIQCVMYV